MALHRKHVSKSALVGETIVGMEFGSPLPHEQGPRFSYAMYTLVMKSGKRFVVSQTMGEVNFSEVVSIPDKEY